MKKWILVVLFLFPVVLLRGAEHQWLSIGEVAQIARNLGALSYPCTQNSVLAVIPVADPLGSLPSMGEVVSDRVVLWVYLTNPKANDGYYIVLIRFCGNGEKDDFSKAGVVEMAEVRRVTSGYGLGAHVDPAMLVER